MRLRSNLAVLSALGLGVAVAAAGVGQAATTVPDDTSAASETTAGGEATAVPGTVSADFEAQWEELIAAAQAEGELSFVSGPGVEEDTPFFEAFGELFGIEISNFGGSTDEVTARVSAERDQGIYDYDIGNLGGSGTANFLDAEFFTELEPLMIHPDLLNHTNFATDYIPWVDETRQYCIYYAVEAEGNIMAFYYNTETVTPEDYDNINSWFDLHDERWRGRIVIGDIAGGEASQDRNLAWVMLGQEWYDGLFANEPTVMPYGSAREHADALIRGDADIGLFPPGDQSLQEAIDQGLPVAQMDKTMSEGSPRGVIQRVVRDEGRAAPGSGPAVPQLGVHRGGRHGLQRDHRHAPAARTSASTCRSATSTRWSTTPPTISRSRCSTSSTPSCSRLTRRPTSTWPPSTRSSGSSPAADCKSGRRDLTSRRGSR